MFTYATLNTNRQSFEKLTDLISKLVMSPSSSEDKSIIAGRYGGEEFLLLLPNFDLPEAITYCQGLLSTIEATEFIPSKTITVSGGVVTNKKGTATEMIQVADTLLYDAKDSGRNQIKYNYC